MNSIWFKEFTEATVSGIPLIVIVLGLTQFIKLLFLARGEIVVRAISAVVGLLIGVAYQYAVLTPQLPSQWLIVAVWGIVMGLIASGIYDVGIGMAIKAGSQVSATLETLARDSAREQ